VGKILFALLTAVIAWVLFKGFTKTATKGDDKKIVRGSSPPPSPPPRPADSQALERMVKCAVCGVHMPESESALVAGKISCREPTQCAHRRAA
jgi:hypothetical protein